LCGGLADIERAAFEVQRRVPAAEFDIDIVEYRHATVQRGQGHDAAVVPERGLHAEVFDHIRLVGRLVHQCDGRVFQGDVFERDVERDVGTSGGFGRSFFNGTFTRQT